MLIIFLSLMLVIGGLFTARDMEIDVFPDLTAPTVVVLTDAHGMAAEEVEALVTFPIESSLNGATDVRRVRSSSSYGFSIVWVEFDWNTDIYRARQIVSEKLPTIATLLPKHIEAPIISPQTSIMGEVMLVSLTSDSLSMFDLRTITTTEAGFEEDIGGGSELTGVVVVIFEVVDRGSGSSSNDLSVTHFHMGLSIGKLGIVRLDDDETGRA